MQVVVKKCCSGVLALTPTAASSHGCGGMVLESCMGFISGVLGTATATHKHRRAGIYGIYGIYEEIHFVVENSRSPKLC